MEIITYMGDPGFSVRRDSYPEKSFFLLPISHIIFFKPTPQKKGVFFLQLMTFFEYLTLLLNKSLKAVLRDIFI